MLLYPLHVAAVPDQVGHFEETEVVDRGGHDRRWKRKVDGSKLQLMEQNLIPAQLTGPENDHFGAVPQCLVGATGKLLG